MKTNFLYKDLNQNTFKIKSEGNKFSTEDQESKGLNREILLMADAVTYRYSQSHKPIINNLSFILKRGERKAVIGKSGAGKSTLLHLLAGIIHPNSGEINHFSNILGFMFQDPNLFPWLNVYQNVVMGLKFLKKEISRDTKNKIFHILEFLEIKKLIKRPVGQLSGGQKQRVALARTLLIEPDILLLDEPFTGIDPETSEHLQKNIVSYTERNNLGLLLVTHNYQEASFMAHEILKLESQEKEESYTYLETVNKENLFSLA